MKHGLTIIIVVNKFYLKMLCKTLLLFQLCAMYHISSNNSQGWLLWIFLHKKGVIFWGRRFFQILLTGSHALNILFCYPNKSKNDHIKQTEHGISKGSKFGSLINFQCVRAWIVTDQFCWIRFHFNLTRRG